MCEQCTAKAEMVVDNVVPGFHLMVATAGSHHWRKGWFGLVEQNDPSFVFEGPLLQDPTWGWSDDAINAMSTAIQAALEHFHNRVEEFESALEADPMTGYRLVSACLQAGYRPREDGSLQYWLMHHMATKAAQSSAA
ncbi:hypothetical protein [Burkholderia ambifaria]|uniref:hypothetical protein n=1 Tax=Burkholderia ambifaria TaxID=152480 RepID=UPI000F80D986|nr:hypothetical protein [Burkholderia ambifaria]